MRIDLKYIYSMSELMYFECELDRYEQTMLLDREFEHEQVTDCFHLDE